MNFMHGIRELLLHENKGIPYSWRFSSVQQKDFGNSQDHLQWPVLADPLSNLRTSVPEDCMHLCIDQYDAF